MDCLTGGCDRLVDTTSARRAPGTGSSRVAPDDIVAASCDERFIAKLASTASDGA